MLWEHVQWSSGEQAGQIVIKAEKNKRHGRQFRTVPMHPVVERELSTLFMQAAEGETHVFPGMKNGDNFGTMTRKQIAGAGVPLWVNPWYNLRKSFCCDLMESGIDPATYEAITDHSYTMAMKHYQIPHTQRLQRRYDKIYESWGLKKGLALRRTSRRKIATRFTSHVFCRLYAHKKRHLRFYASA